MRYLSLCSGIEAASVAWRPLGWRPVACAEIDKFPCAVLAHHYPTVPNYGDITRFADWPEATVDVLIGGTPCQSFSVAGLRQGLADPRGNLALTYLAVAERYRPRWVVWENVPGVLSSTSHDAPDSCPPTDDVDEGTERLVEDEYDADESHAFACFLAGLSELGYGLAYGSLDAQYAGLAQRRLRVFVVGHLGDWRRAAAVLFERESLSGHPAPRREAGARVTGSLASRASAGGGFGTDFDCDGGLIHVEEISRALTACHTATGCLDPNEMEFIAFSVKDHGADAGELAPTLRAGGHAKSHANGGCMPAVAFDWQSGGDMRGIDPRPLAQLQSEQIPATLHGMQVRRLTPRECERLQGFPDDYTLIPYRGKPAADGPRYKALGNSMAVPVVRWIGERMQMVENL